jgi:hypothetical protein
MQSENRRHRFVFSDGAITPLDAVTRVMLDQFGRSYYDAGYPFIAVEWPLQSVWPFSFKGRLP